MNSDTIWQLIRYALMAAGGFVVSKGWITNDNLTQIVGAMGTLFVTAWGLYIKWGTTSVPDTTAARKDVPTISPVTGAVIPGNQSTGS
jgi:hypothetical protein